MTGPTPVHAHGAGCSCAGPLMRRISRRLTPLSRRGFLSGLGAAAAAGTFGGQALAQAPPQTLFRQIRLFDGKSNSLRSNVQVLVEGGRIAAVDTTNSAPPAGATVIDCGDRVLMPGLIDAHWHAIYAAAPMQMLMTGDPGFIFTTAVAEAQRTLMRGFTTVRDLGGPSFSFKQMIDGGVVPGPRIYPSGTMITTSGGHGDLRMPYEIPRDGARLSMAEALGAAAIADSADELRLRVREQLLQGASQVKLVAGGGVSSPRSPLDIATYSEDDLRAAAQVARDWNTYVTIHASADHNVRRSIAAGAPCIEHAHLMEEATARLIAEREIWLSTQPFLTMADAASQTGPGVERLQLLFAGTPRIYGYIKRYGIKAAWGSDILFSPELTPRQNIMLTHLAEWFSNAEVLRAATSVNGELMALSNMRNPYPGKLGVIEADAHADLLVLNGNPIDDIRVIETPATSLALIMKGGQIHKNML